MRKSSADEKSLRGIVAMIIRYLISLGFGYLLVYLNTLWSYSFIFVLLLYFVHNAFENLFTTWIIHFRGYKITDIFNLKNSLKLVLSGFALIGINAVIIIVLYFVTGALLAILIALPLFAYVFAVMDIIAVSHFRGLEEKGKLSLREEKEKKKAVKTAVKAGK